MWLTPGVRRQKRNPRRNPKLHLWKSHTKSDCLWTGTSLQPQVRRGDDRSRGLQQMHAVRPRVWQVWQHCPQCLGGTAWATKVLSRLGDVRSRCLVASAMLARGLSGSIVRNAWEGGARATGAMNVDRVRDERIAN